MRTVIALPASYSVEFPIIGIGLPKGIRGGARARLGDGLGEEPSNSGSRTGTSGIGATGSIGVRASKTALPPKTVFFSTKQALPWGDAILRVIPVLTLS